MANYVLIHGGTISSETWNRLAGRDDYPPGVHLGGRIWDGTRAALEARGHRVLAPTLEDEHATGLSGHVGQVCRLIAGEDLRDVVLVGHSYGGMVVTGVVDRIPERIARAVYLDAALPEPGESLFDLFAAASSDPLSFAGLEAARAYVERIAFDPDRLRHLPRTYIRCEKSEFAAVAALALSRIAASGEAWTYLELPSSHVPQADRPDALNRLLLDVSSR
ncbi:MAG: alpha/beta hydrolase [Methanospirillum sp.]